MKFINAKDIEGLGVSPAKSYGYVAGSDARFFGQGIINFPKGNLNHPFRVFLRKKGAGGYEYKVRLGYIDGTKVDGTGENDWKPCSIGNPLIAEAEISSEMAITSARITSAAATEPFRAQISGGVQTKARIIIAQFETENNSVTVNQNVTTNLMAPLYCYQGYAAKILVQEFANP